MIPSRQSVREQQVDIYRWIIKDLFIGQDNGIINCCLFIIYRTNSNLEAKNIIDKLAEAVSCMGKWIIIKNV